MMYCRKCKEEHSDNSKFCPSCGSKLSQQKKSESLLKTPFFAVAVVVLVVIIFSLIYVNQNSSITGNIIIPSNSLVTHCGDGRCDSKESCETCPDDCGKCKKVNGYICSAGSECQSGYCVHSACRPSSPYCGDGYCDNGENYISCLNDCPLNQKKNCPASCDDGDSCTYDSCGQSSDYECKHTKTSPCCGNKICESGESCSTCSNDCGVCKKDNGVTCSLNSECAGGYCVHGYCRSTSSYCRDGYCDTGESCSSCEQDCGSCELFTIGDSYGSDDADNYVKVDSNYYRILPSARSSAIIFPITFNQEARNVEFKIMCYGNGERLDSSADPNNVPYSNVYASKEFGSYMAYFGFGTSKTFLLKGGRENFGTEIEYTSEGMIRVIIYPDIGNDSKGSITMDCQLIVTSHNPPWKNTKDFKLRFG